MIYKITGTYCYQLEAPPPSYDVGMIPTTNPQPLEKDGRIIATFKENPTLTGFRVESRYLPE